MIKIRPRYNRPKTYSGGGYTYAQNSDAIPLFDPNANFLSGSGYTPQSNSAMLNAAIGSNASPSFDWRTALTGIDPAGGGYDQFGQPIPGRTSGGAISGMAGVLGAGLDLITANKQIRDQEAKKLEAEGVAADTRSEIEKLINRDTISQTTRDLAATRMQPTDVSPLLSSQATALDALSSDPRAAFNVAPVASQTNKAILDARMRDAQASNAALADLAQAETAQNEAQKEALLGLTGGDYTRALGDVSTAAANIEGLKQSKRDAFGNIITGLGQTALSMATGLPTAENGMKIKYQMGGVLDQIMADNGRPVVQKTTGEFNHDTNKKAIVDEETGVKEGEATGGEYIINPEHSANIHSAYLQVEDSPSMENLMALYEAVQKVFSQPQFNEAEERVEAMNEMA